MIPLPEPSPSPLSPRLLRNAGTVLETSCRAAPGETLLLLADEILLPYAPALAAAALDLGLIPTTLDIRHYVASEQYADGYVLESVKQAIEASDIVLQNLADTWIPNRPGYGRLCGEPDLHDLALTAERRWMILQCRGLEEWEVDPVEIAAIRKRTLSLLELLKNARQGRITSSAGTDLTFSLGKGASAVPILGIIPFYGEVAVTPALENTSGLLVVDGPTQCGIRPDAELNREPLRIAVERGKMVDASGDPTHLDRLRAFVASGAPPADAIDEVGILTTTLVENDRYYWSDGTHHHDRIHVALGNNTRRDAVVHGPQHADTEIDRPTVSIDGRVIIENGTWIR